MVVNKLLCGSGYHSFQNLHGKYGVGSLVFVGFGSRRKGAGEVKVSLGLTLAHQPSRFAENAGKAFLREQNTGAHLHGLIQGNFLCPLR